MATSYALTRFTPTETAPPTTQDVTSASFGTAQLALFVGQHIAEDPDVVGAGAAFSIGATDGVNEAFHMIRDRDASSELRKRAGQDTTASNGTLCVHTSANGGDLQYAGRWNSWITDGVRIDVTNVAAGSKSVVAAFFKGFDNVYVGEANASSTQDGTVGITAPGFTPDIFIVLWSDSVVNNTTSVGNHFSLGFAVRNGSQVCASHFYEEAVTSNVKSFVASNRVAKKLLAASTSSGLEVTSWDANGVTVTTRDSAGGGLSQDFIYIALKLPAGEQAWCGTINTPTATGSTDFTAPGFQPTFGMIVPSYNSALDTVDTGTGAG